MANTNFIDYVKIFCRSGKGGAGSAHLHRDRRTSKGGPDGGNGGRGGHIILRGNRNRWTLLHLKYQKHNFAENGRTGGASHKTGAEGKDTVLEVPLGTIAKNAETGETLFEITQHEEQKILLHGGRGGRGNAHFKSSVNQTPRYAQSGEEGTEDWFILELKVLADVGLVGFPNAGKSSLLNALSAAKPKVADYEFTTMQAHLGVVAYRDEQSFVMADIPGIIEGASEGKGLGLRFLRHIERNAVLLFMIPVDVPDIGEQYRILLKELKKHNPELLDKERLLAISKSDLADEELRRESIKELPPDTDYVFISSISRLGLQELKDKLWQKLY